MIFLKRRALMTRASFNYKTVSGIGSITLENCVETRFKRLSLSGNSVQTTTKGLQLLDKTKIPTPQAGVAYYNMQVEEGKYTLSTKYRRAVQKDLFLFAGEVDTGASSVINGVDSTISRTVESINGYITIGYRKGENGVNPFDFETMLNKGDTPLPYEPYTGGKPSPSVEYPQEIVSAGKWNEISGKYLIDVEVKKYKKVSLEKGSLQWGSGEEIVHNGTRSNFVDISGMNKNFVFLVSPKHTLAMNLFFYTENKKYMNAVSIQPEKHYEKCSQYSYRNAPDGARYIRVSLNMYTYNENDEILIEEGSQSQTVQLKLDRPLTKWDRIEKRDGVYGIVYKHRIVEDFATLVKDNEPIYGNTGEKYFSVVLKDATLNYDYSKVYSEVGLYKKDVQKLYVPRVMVSSFTVGVNDTDTIETAKTHLHYKVIYETDSEEFVPLSEETQLALENLHANNGTTVITVDSGEVETGIEVEYAIKN